MQPVVYARRHDKPQPVQPAGRRGSGGSALACGNMLDQRSNSADSGDTMLQALRLAVKAEGRRFSYQADEVVR